MSAVSQVEPAAPETEGQLVEVWGDTVDERHVKIAVLLGVVVSAPSFLLAQSVFTATMDNRDLARTYAMLVGLAACLVVAVVCARLFPPKRIVTERAIVPEEQMATVMELARQPGGIGELASLSEAERDEMKRLGLYDLFAEAERRISTEGTAALANSNPEDSEDSGNPAPFEPSATTETTSGEQR
ncbi:hypothetical protein [Nocardia callitridis]|uniref:Uncharacterized protein n=1 Tax=Nocardia callitridis TaxID=648753 RepID=A0ABP9KRU3_9NOCA